MLSTLCHACRRPRGLHEMHTWLGASPVCSAECAQKLGDVSEDPDALRHRALRALSRARRLSAHGNQLNQLVDDRHQAAGRILGLTKSGRREKAELLQEAERFQNALDSVEYRFEESLLALVGALMGLRQEMPEGSEYAVELAREHPGNRVTLAVQERTQRLADLLGKGPTPLARETVTSVGLRVERHLDAVVGYESVSLSQGGASAWNLTGSAAWDTMGSAELIDRAIVIRLVNEEERVEIRCGKNAEAVWQWLAAERPDLGASERSMTLTEALTPPGCALLGVLGVGGALAGGAGFFGLPELLVLSLWGLTGLLALLATGWGVREVVVRRKVPQLGVVERQFRAERVLPSRG